MTHSGPEPSDQPVPKVFGRNHFRDSMRKPGSQVFPCEPRLALSASLAADLLLSAADVLADDPTDGDWLLDQAAEVREMYGIDGAGQTVAVIDSGIAWDHVALGGGFGPGYRVVGGWDFAEQDDNPYDDGPAGFHGSHVAGLLSGESDGFTGIAPGADLVALRVFNDQGKGSLDAIEGALQWVYSHQNDFENPITTVNLSLGAILNDNTTEQVMGQLEDEFRLLHDSGVMVVAAAGNQYDPDFPDRVAYPATSSWVTAVGAIDADGALSNYSQRENDLLTAPGNQVTSSVPDHVFGWDGNVDDFSASTGTSMASPQVAGASVLVRQAMEMANPEQTVTSAQILQHLRDTSLTNTDPSTGLVYHTVDLQAAVGSLLDSIDIAGPPDLGNSVTDNFLPDAEQFLGAVDSQAFALQVDEWYEVEMTHEGIFTLSGGAGSDFVVRNANGDLLQPLAGGSDSQLAASQVDGQTDYLVDAKQRLFVRLEASSDQTVIFNNLLQLNSGKVEVFGTGDGDTVRLDLSDAVRIEINGAKYQINPTNSPLALHMEAGGGGDELTIQGSTGSERIALYPAQNVQTDTNQLTSEMVEATFAGFETVAFDGGGGADQASVYGTPGDDQLTASPQSASLTGAGYAFDIQQVPRIYVHAQAGGEDTAFLYDSAGDDTLVVRPQFSSLRSEQHFNLAYGFERVYAFATAGGKDVAQLYDSAGDDRMSASAISAGISGRGYFASARFFETIEANSNSGGNDIANLYAASDQVSWQQASGLVRLSDLDEEGNILLRTARGFDQVGTFLNSDAISIARLSIPSPVEGPELADPMDPQVLVPEIERRAALLGEVAEQTDRRGGMSAAKVLEITESEDSEISESNVLLDWFARFGS
ncbi:Subtilisin E precursor [Roseimaritima multifibrata]|uniref:Subtilisin E n=2 Tax=Roseimaritima multifibrata TaxID=1930274 RepID=A0A517MKF5_9BACT|nr:Subtilisin E precursor [Roseimaritima multifibrata]